MRSKLIAGGVLAFFGTVLALKGASDGNQSLINAGIGGIFLGIVLMTFSTSEYVKKDALLAAATSQLEFGRSLVRSLGLENSAVYIPPYENLENGGLFIPLYSDFDLNLAGIDENTVFITDVGREKEMGLILPVPGNELVKKFEEYLEVEFTGSGIYAVENSSHVLRSLGLARSVTVEEKGEEVNVYVDGVIFREFCSDLCKQIPCPVCGSVLLSLAKSLNQLIRVESMELDNGGVTIKVRKLGGVNRWM